MPQAAGISGGLPGNAAYEVIVRHSNIRDLLASQGVPDSLAAIDGEPEIIPPALETDLGWDDVYFTEWQGGGGYGDPLLRDPDLVLADLRNGKITARAADQVYGLVTTGADLVDQHATRTRRDLLRRARAAGGEVQP